MSELIVPNYPKAFIDISVKDGHGNVRFIPIEAMISEPFAIHKNMDRITANGVAVPTTEDDWTVTHINTGMSFTSSMQKVTLERACDLKDRLLSAYPAASDVWDEDDPKKTKHDPRWHRIVSIARGFRDQMSSSEVAA